VFRRRPGRKLAGGRSRLSARVQPELTTDCAGRRTDASAGDFSALTAFDEPMSAEGILAGKVLVALGAAERLELHVDLSVPLEVMVAILGEERKTVRINQKDVSL
jgi:hypothetical protein